MGSVLDVMLILALCCGSENTWLIAKGWMLVAAVTL